MPQCSFVTLVGSHMVTFCHVNFFFSTLLLSVAILSVEKKSNLGIKDAVRSGAFKSHHPLVDGS